MLVSRARGVIFVHIQKTGGDTVARLLREHLPDVEQVGPKHDLARRARPALADLWDGAFKFAVVRNPWDRMVSWWSMIRDAGRITWRDRIFHPRQRRHHIAMRQNPLWGHAMRHGPTFEAFIRDCGGPIDMGGGVTYSFGFNQLDYITDEEGGLLVDEVGRFENLGADLRAVFARFGVTLAEIPHENPSARAGYRDYYTPELREIVAERFRPDIEHFGYTFQ